MKATAGRLAKAAVLGAWLLITLFPLYWIAVTSLKPKAEIFSMPLRYWPGEVTFEHYEELFSFADFGAYLLNSLVVSLVAVVGLFISVIVAGLRNLPKIRDPRLRDAAIAVVGMTMFIAFVSTRGWALDQDPFAYYYYLFVGFMFKLPTLANQPVAAGRPVGRVGMAGRGPRHVPVSGVRPTVR